jgi:hypothetical protein
MSNVPLAIFEVFHPVSHIVGTHAEISIDIKKSIKDVCSRTVLLYEELNHSIYRHFVTVDYATYTGPVFQITENRYSYWPYKP